MRRLIFGFLLLWMLAVGAYGADISEKMGLEDLEQALPEAAQEYIGEITPEEPGDLKNGMEQIVTGCLKDGTILKAGVGLCVQITGIILLAATMGAFGDGKTLGAVGLGAVLAVGLCCLGRISGLFTQVAEAVDALSAFSGFLFSSLAATTAATGAVGASGAMYGVTVAVCSGLTRLLQGIFLPGVSCYLGLMLASAAVGEGSLSMVGDLLKQGLTLILKFGVIGFTAYLSLSGAISGSADAATIRAAKLAISTAVPVVGSLMADASETLLVSAGILRSGVGIFGMLGVLAVAMGPFLETGISYLGLKLTAAVAAAAGEKQLSGLIGSMATGFGLLTALVGVAALLMIIACVCFMQVGVG